jgi:hypothetical protein
MDAIRFDRLTRAVSINLLAPRRAALSALGGGLVALLTRFGIDDVEAKKKKKKKTCAPCRKKKKGKCKGKKPDGTPCGNGKVCQGGACVCPAGCCTNADCGDDQTCVDGTCICPAGTVRCDANCFPGTECCSDIDCDGDLECTGGFCLCPGGAITCGADECCNPAADEVCAISNRDETCQGGGCPETSFCHDETTYTCNQTCTCVTSVEGTTVCSSGRVACSVPACTTDAECTELLMPLFGVPGVCISGGGNCTIFCGEQSTICVTATCDSGVSRRANGRSGPTLADTLRSAR